MLILSSPLIFHIDVDTSVTSLTDIDCVDILCGCCSCAVDAEIRRLLLLRSEALSTTRWLVLLFCEEKKRSLLDAWCQLGHLGSFEGRSIIPLFYKRIVKTEIVKLVAECSYVIHPQMFKTS